MPTPGGTMLGLAGSPRRGQEGYSAVGRWQCGGSSVGGSVVAKAAGSMWSCQPFSVHCVQPTLGSPSPVSLSDALSPQLAPCLPTTLCRALLHSPAFSMPMTAALSPPDPWGRGCGAAEPTRPPVPSSGIQLPTGLCPAARSCLHSHGGAGLSGTPQRVKSHPGHSRGTVTWGGPSPPPRAAVGSGAGQAGMWRCRGALHTPHGRGVMRHRWQPARAASRVLPCSRSVRHSNPLSSRGVTHHLPAAPPFLCCASTILPGTALQWGAGVGGAVGATTSPVVPHPPQPVSVPTPRPIPAAAAPGLGRSGGCSPCPGSAAVGLSAPSAARAWGSSFLGGWGQRGAGTGRGGAAAGRKVAAIPPRPPWDLFPLPSLGSRRSCAWRCHSWQRGGRFPQERVPRRGLPVGVLAGACRVPVPG